MPPAVQPVAVRLPVVGNPPTVRSRAAAPIKQVAQARPAALPFTGSETDTLLTTAIGLLMLGCAVVAAGRRRKMVSIG
jgi:LPXTG-motif cell wall-anchored protein